MKKTIAWILTLAMVLGCFACSAPKAAEAPKTEPAAAGTADQATIETMFGPLPADGPEINLVLASDAAETAIHSQAMCHLEELLKKETQGKLTITYYPNAQLGSDVEIMNSCVAGDIDMDLMSGALAQSIVPESCLFNIPFLNNAKDIDAIIKTMVDGEFRTNFDACYEKAGSLYKSNTLIYILIIQRIYNPSPALKI